LQGALELLVITLNLQQVIIGEFSPLLFELTFELRPSAFELILVHNTSLLLAEFLWCVQLNSPPLSRAYSNDVPNTDSGVMPHFAESCGTLSGNGKKIVRVLHTPAEKNTDVQIARFVLKLIGSAET
jgi:hypothetical protein